MSRIRDEAEKIILIAFRIEQGKHKLSDIAEMYGVSMSLVREVEQMSRFISGRKYKGAHA
jgi:phage portal protein BeeE